MRNCIAEVTYRGERRIMALDPDDQWFSLDDDDLGALDSAWDDAEHISDIQWMVTIPADDALLLANVVLVNRNRCRVQAVRAAEAVVAQIDRINDAVKIDEPTGFGAVVKDRHGDEWVRVGSDTQDDLDVDLLVWLKRGTSDDFQMWNRIDAVEKRSDGVE